MSGTSSASVMPKKFVNGTTAYALENGRDVVYVTGAMSGSTMNLYRYVVNDVNDPLTTSERGAALPRLRLLANPGDFQQRPQAVHRPVHTPWGRDFPL